MIDRAGKHAGPVLALLVLISLPWAWVTFAGQHSIQWDAASYFYPYQHHFSESIRAGRLPLWTSGLFSGFPFIADMQVGAWYPPNWPFFLAGIGPRSLFVELWLHALLAGVGAYLLVFDLFRRAGPAVFAGLAYALGGFFSAHAEHICLFQSAAWLPLMLWLLIRGIERRSNTAIALAAVAGGFLCLAGHFQTALYVMTALVLAAAACCLEARGRNVRRVVTAVAVIGLGSALLSAVQTLPSAELVAYSLRARLQATDFAGGILTGRSLATFVIPTTAGAFSAVYSGPQDITQHYFFAGTLLVAMALGGLWFERRRRGLILALMVPALWYSAGPAAGLYSLVIRLPGFASVRAPSHAMFVVTLGLAVAAAAFLARFGSRRIVAGLCLFTAAELFLWNFERSRMVYGRENFVENQRRSDRWLAGLVNLPLAPGSRLAAPERWEGVDFGATQFHLETTFGANALMPARYFDFLKASNRNYELLRELGVSRYFEPGEWKVNDLAGWLPRFYAPANIEPAPDRAGRLGRLQTLNPSTTMLVETPLAGPVPNGRAGITLTRHSEQHYEAAIDAEGNTLVRIAVPWFPGWRAAVDGHSVEIIVADHALMAVRVPNGRHRLTLDYRQNYLAAGAMISLITLAVLLGVAAFGERGCRRF
ncbi:MAG: YfhO family protein [Bryobacterales bacterium]|nr:YfhO family protein [Bryobacterales bacterium]